MGAALAGRRAEGLRETPMPVRRRGKRLERWEIALVKAMVADGRWPNDQDILAYFTRPTRSINHRAISEIRTGAKHAAVKAASSDDLDSFLATWPDVDAETGLSLRGDELLIKAREAMIAAVHTFNSAGLTFRAELFIVTAIIAWTYLLHAWFKREGIDCRHTKSENGQKVVVTTPSGADKYWELSQCLKHAKCPVEPSARDNLTFLLELRHEIEHRSTSRIDDAVSAKLQACCINFNDAIKGLFGAQYALERRLPIALQFVTFSPDQRALLKKAATLPRHIESMMDAFEASVDARAASGPALCVPRLHGPQECQPRAWSRPRGRTGATRFRHRREIQFGLEGGRKAKISADRNRRDDGARGLQAFHDGKPHTPMEALECQGPSERLRRYRGWETVVLVRDLGQARA